MGKDWRTPEEEAQDAKDGPMLGLEALFLGLLILGLIGAGIKAWAGL